MRGQALSIALLAFALGLVAGPVAEAGCAGPLLTVMHASFEPVPPDSSDPSAEPTYHMRAGQQVTVQASNLGLCSDTDVVIGGCAVGRPQQRPTASPVPVRNVALHFEQGSRRWDLGLADATAPDYTIDYRSSCHGTSSPATRR
jgi:hypothetical protein